MTGDSASGGDPTECTDELFSFWQACRTLAYYENPSPCDPCGGGNLCQNAECSIECTEMGNPPLDVALAACDASYPLCADVIPDPIPNPYNECIFECSHANQECIAMESPICDATAVSACSMTYNNCFAAC